MSIRAIASLALIAAVLCATAARAQDSPKDLAQAVEEVKQVEAKMAKGSEAEKAALMSDDMIDVHSSGWLYNKKENLAIDRNLPNISGKSKVISSKISDQKMIAYNKDTVIETAMTTVYYEVPNPEDVARAAGTETFEPAAMARAETAAKAKGPGLAASLNPFRTRATRVWVRVNGHWLLAASIGSTVRERTIPGRL